MSASGAEFAVSPWRLSWCADPVVAKLADGHYPRQKPGTRQFSPPGRKLVLKTPDGLAGWVTSWPFPEYVNRDWATAWVNTLFCRTGGPHLASDLIRWATAHTRAWWPEVPEHGIITMVDPAGVKDKDIPGWCYLRAGWSHVGYTKERGLWVYQQIPDRRISRRSKPMPPPVAVPGSQAVLDFGEAV